MKYSVFLAILFSVLVSCNPKGKAGKGSAKIVYQPEDKQILEEIFELLGNEKEEPTGALVVKVGMFFTGTPYVAHTLETEPEQLVINLREMDCTTFAENCLAIAKTIKSGKPSFEKFAEELQDIRYRNGKINGYTSRLHYFSDWIFNNDKMEIVKDVSKQIADKPYRKKVNFMSKHPDSHSQLKSNSLLVNKIADQEKEISNRQMYYMPNEKIAEVENQLMDGDIGGITTRIEGLDVSHVAILIRKAGRIHLLHASSTADMIIISDETLEEYLNSSKLTTGIMVARPL